MRSIFVNYRRNDSQGEAGRLFDDLTLRFGREAVFMDVTAIEPGRDFRKAIDHSVASCSVLLAMIGQDWLDSQDPRGGRRLDDANDFVRIELASALRRDIPVVPVLVRGAKMPRAEQLPDDLKELVYRNAVELTHARWKSDVQVLIEALEPCLTAPGSDHAAADGFSAEKRAAGAEMSISGSQVGGREPFASPAAPIEARTIERVTRELAAFIGPIAEVVVKRAAKRCCSAEDLCAMVAREIEAEGDRTKFLRSCRGPGGQGR